MRVSRTRSRVFFAVTAALLLGAIEVSATVPAGASASRPQSAGALGDGSAPSLHIDVTLRSDDINGDMVSKFRDAVAFSVGAATPDDAAVSVTFPVVGVLAFDEVDDTKVDLAAVAATVATSLGTPLGTVSTRIFPVDGRLAQMVAAMGAAIADVGNEEEEAEETAERVEGGGFLIADEHITDLEDLEDLEEYVSDEVAEGFLDSENVESVDGALEPLPIGGIRFDLTRVEYTITVGAGDGESDADAQPGQLFERAAALAAAASDSIFVDRIADAVGVSAEAETVPEVRCALAVDVTLPEGASAQEATETIEGYSGARLIAAALAADGLRLTVDPVAVTQNVQTPAEQAETPAEDDAQDYAYGVEEPSTPAPTPKPTPAPTPAPTPSAMAPAMAPGPASIEAFAPTPEPTPEPISARPDPAADRYDEGFADGIAAGEDGMDPGTAADVASGLHDPTRYAEGYAAGVAASAKPGEDDAKDLYQRGFLDGFQEAKGGADEAAAAYARRTGDSEAEADATASSATAEEEVVVATASPTESDLPTDVEAVLRILTPTEGPEASPPAVEISVVPAEPARAARLTPGEGRGHKGAMDVVKTLGLDPALVKALDAVEVEEEEEDASVYANKTPAARARIAERVRARRIAGRVAYRAGARAARDAVLKKFGASSAAMAAVDAAFPEVRAEDDDDLLEGGDDPLTEEERAVAGRDGYREGLKTANAALATAYRVADVVTRGDSRATAALGSFAFSDAFRGALGASGRERDANDARVGDGREARRGVMSARRRAVYAGWAAALAAAAAAAAARARRGAARTEGDEKARERLVADAEGQGSSARERYGASMV